MDEASILGKQLTHHNFLEDPMDDVFCSFTAEQAVEITQTISTIDVTLTALTICVMVIAAVTFFSRIADNK